MVSALIPTKRVEIGIEAVSHISDAHLVVAGDGPLRQSIDAQAARMLPGRFTRLTVAPELMPILYQSADVFLHLAKEESFGNIFLEAVACGLPVVAHDSSRLRWIVGEDEYLLDTGLPAAAISQHIQYARQTLAKQEGRVARARAFSISRIARMYLDFFEEIIVSRKK